MNWRNAGDGTLPHPELQPLDSATQGDPGIRRLRPTTPTPRQASRRWMHAAKGAADFFRAADLCSEAVRLAVKSRFNPSNPRLSADNPDAGVGAGTSNRSPTTATPWLSACRGEHRRSLHPTSNPGDPVPILQCKIRQVLVTMIVSTNGHLRKGRAFLSNIDSACVREDVP